MASFVDWKSVGEGGDVQKHQEYKSIQRDLHLMESGGRVGTQRIQVVWGWVWGSHWVIIGDGMS